MISAPRMALRTACGWRRSVAATANAAWLRRRQMQHNLAYQGWVETVSMPRTSSVSPLERIGQMMGGSVDRRRFMKEPDFEPSIKAIEIWKKQAQSYADSAVNGIANACVVLKLDDSSSCFVFNRTQDGIQTSRVPLDDDGVNVAQCAAFDRSQMVKVQCYNKKKESALPMMQLAQYLIKEQSK